MSLTAPSKINIPFAQSGARNVINDTLGTGDAGNKATNTYGFPEITMTPKSAGGLPPFGRDMNGILFSITSMVQYLQAGGTYVYDATFANAIGGYGKGAIVQQEDLSGLWVSTVDNNTSNPETSGADWMPLDSGSHSFNVTTANVTLTNAQAAHPVLIIGGRLTGSRIVFVPKFRQIWTIVNNVDRQGIYTLTIKTATGTGVALRKPIEQVVCDGVNVYKVGGESSDQVPIGGKIDWYSPNIPEGYLLANGQAVSRLLYPELFAVYGTFYGAGDGVNTFNIPNLIGYFGRYGNTDSVGRKVNGSIASHTHGVTQNAHTHTVTQTDHTHGASQAAHNHTATQPAHNHTITQTDHTHGASQAAHNHSGTTGGAGKHSHTRGTMNITGQHKYGGDFDGMEPNAFYSEGNSGRGWDSDGSVPLTKFDASRSWVGKTSEQANHAHGFTTGNATPAVTVNGAKANISLANAQPAITVGNATPAVTVNGAKANISLANAQPAITVGNATPAVTVNGAKANISLNAADADISINAFGGSETAPMHFFEIPIIRAL